MIIKSDLSVDQHLFAEASEAARVPLAEVLRIAREVALLHAADGNLEGFAAINGLENRLREAFAAPTRGTK